MFGPPGFAYVYRSYGIHWCVNFVCEKEGSASAVLIRALQPTHGIPAMRRRRGLHDERSLCSGPGKLTEALGVTDTHNGLPLDAPPIALHARLEKPDIAAGVRIGISAVTRHNSSVMNGMNGCRSLRISSSAQAPWRGFVLGRAVRPVSSGLLSSTYQSQ